MTAKVLFTGKTHNTNGRDGAARSSDGTLDLKLPEPHPAAENLFGAAWSACYMGALQLAAAQKIDLNQENAGFFLRAHLYVSVPGVEREVAEDLIHAAHGICPYSKAVHNNIDVETTLV